MRIYGTSAANSQYHYWFLGILHMFIIINPPGNPNLKNPARHIIIDPKQVAVNPKLTLSSQPPHLSHSANIPGCGTQVLSAGMITPSGESPHERLKKWRLESWGHKSGGELSGIHGVSTTHQQRKSIPLFALFDVICDLPQDDTLKKMLQVGYCQFICTSACFWNTDDKKQLDLWKTITWISVQETNCWEVVEVHVTECHTFGLWRSIFTFATGTDNQKNQMWRTKWMSVGNALVTCGLSNNVTHHLCFWSDASPCCRFIWLLWLYTLSTIFRFQLWLPLVFCFFALHLFCFFALPCPRLQLSLLGGIFLHPHCQHPFCYPACSSNISTWQEKSGERHTRHVF